MPLNDSAYGGHLDAHAIGLFQETVEAIFWNRAENLVIVAACHGEIEKAWIVFDRSPHSGRKRHAIRLNLSRGAADPHHLGKIARKAIGHVHGSMGMIPDHMRKPVPRLRVEIAVGEMGFLMSRQILSPVGMLAELQSQGRIANGAAHADHVTGLGVAASNHAPGGHVTDSRHGEGQSPSCLYRIAAQQRTTEIPRGLSKPLSKLRKPFFRPGIGKRKAQEETCGICAFGRDIRHVNPQSFPRDGSWRVFGKKVHRLDQRVGRQHEIVPGLRREGGGIIFQAKSALACQRREETGDEPVFGKALGTLVLTIPAIGG